MERPTSVEERGTYSGASDVPHSSMPHSFGGFSNSDSLGPRYPMKDRDQARAQRPNGFDPVLRFFDVVLSSILLVILAPLLLVAAFAIKVSSPGPVFFKQARHGLHGQRFTILKFRTMRHDPKPQAFKQTNRDDDRITAVGSFLRRTSIDELPQLINVILGDMSLVGPRPLPTALDYEMGGELPYYAQRFFVRPGITGLAQSRGHRGAIESKAALRTRTILDVIYVRRRSIGLYWSVLIATALAFLFHDNAF